jgi:hypothetical protein
MSSFVETLSRRRFSMKLHLSYVNSRTWSSFWDNSILCKMRRKLFVVNERRMIANRIFYQIVKIILSFYQNIEHDVYDHDQYRL